MIKSCMRIFKVLMKMDNGLVDYLLKSRYCHPGETGWDDICRRVAGALSGDESERADFHHVMQEKLFIPNSPTLMNAGTGVGQLSACFVLPIDDPDGIDKIVAAVMNIHQSGGGTGFSFGKLKPSYSPEKTTYNVLSVMNIIDRGTEISKRKGRRRGANIAVLPVWHPEITEFINCKRKDGVLSNFNISVAVTDDFLERVVSEEEQEYKLAYDRYGEGKPVDPKVLSREICDNMWRNGEPGILFIDRVNQDSPYDIPIESTNPCGEQPLPPYGICNLGSIDVSKFYDKKMNEFDYEEFRRVIGIAVTLLDNVIDRNRYILPEIEEFSRAYRPIGLGLMGFADLCIMYGFRYGDDDSVKLAEQLAMALINTAREVSKERAGEYGGYRLSPDYRNATLTSYAPTGTISLIAGCSAGIEPNFAFEYNRRIWGDGEEIEFRRVHPLWEEYVRLHGDQCLPDYFVTAMEILPEKHIDIQAAFQEYCDSGISKTINIPFGYDRRRMEDLVIYAWRKGCKGFTIYRAGSRAQVMDSVEGRMSDDDKRTVFCYCR